ncbi:L-arabinose isomerase [Crateriforma spongiae]|uniref:L-arabinose isomerase n=1 Tax=Crateriforma spongiae TaxID=2724528 RepID=UPI0014452668|nr:L-arabinose isomerase [Crateriforma spongiae]
MSSESSKREVWFVTGSQHLYGDEALRQVAANGQSVVDGLVGDGRLPVSLVFKPIVTTPDAITRLCRDADADPRCIGLVCWMHTFSPAKMWIAGLSGLTKPIAHLHTQFNAELPWSTIDMDFMNLNQSAHGGREFGHICARLNVPRKVIVGHWQDPSVQERLAIWMRAASGRDEMRNLRVARIGDNMRQVAVTEGDKVEAQRVFGTEINGYGIGDLVDCVNQVTDSDADALAAEYEQAYQLDPSLQRDGQKRQSLLDAAKQELGLRSFLQSVGAMALTDTFEDLHGLQQLPGLAIQRLMADGYGFGAEGDWKTSALLRAIKVMADGLDGGTSFMEDYTYHFQGDDSLCLGAHMLEICPSIAADQPRCEIHPLGIGGKSDPVRLVFTAPAGPAVNVALTDMGDRFRLLVNEVETVTPPHDLPNLPVARALWKPLPDLRTAAAAWIYAGGPHHTVFSQAVGSEMIEDFADMIGVECRFIDADTSLRSFKQTL